MKEAQGELNMTVIVVILVALLSFFFFTYLWPGISANFAHNTMCDEAICTCPEKDLNGKCTYTGEDPVTCTYTDRNGDEQEITCIWKG